MCSGASLGSLFRGLLLAVLGGTIAVLEIEPGQPSHSLPAPLTTLVSSAKLRGQA